MPESPATSFTPTPEQALAIRSLAPYVLVSASAGTGKTRTLVERVLFHLEQGVALDRMLIITFTRKAAGELKARLYDAFGANPRLRPLRLTLPQAHVATIDGFCSRLLREQALLAGVDPGFTVISDPDDRLLRDEILDEIFHHWYLGRPAEEAPTDAWREAPERGSDAHHEFLRLVELCGMRAGRELLKDELLRLLDLARVHPQPDAFIDRLESGLDAAAPPYLAALAEDLLRRWRGALAIYEQMIEVGTQSVGTEALAKQRAFADRLSAAPAPWGNADRAGASSSGDSADPRRDASSGGGADPRRDANSGGGAGGETQGLEALGASVTSLLEGVRSLRRHLKAVDAFEDAASWTLAWPSLPRGAGKALKPLHERAKALLGHGSSRVSPFAQIPADPEVFAQQYRAIGPTLRTLLTLLRRLMASYEEAKRARGVLDFADLELRTVELLRRAPTELLTRFDMVLVDEVQDINALQAEVIDRLQPARGRFLVGDIKQCIYQFRLADPTIFRAHFAEAQILRPQGGDGAAAGRSATAVRTEKARLFLSKNFRSRYPVLEVVNGIFARLMPTEMLGGDYAREALRFHATGQEEGQARSWDDTAPTWSHPGQSDRALPAGRGWAPVEVHLIDKSPSSRRDAATSDVVAEARFVGRRIAALVAEGFPVYDSRQRRWRDLRYRDVAVILRSPGVNGPEFARGLRAEGIPIAAADQDFFDREEVRDALNLVALLSNAHNDVALAAVLRSPAIGFDDNDAMRVRLAYPHSHALLAALRAVATGRGDVYSGPPDRLDLLADPGARGLRQRADQFLRRLDRWRFLAQGFDLPAALTSMLNEGGLLDLSASHEDGAARVANLETLIAVARRYCRERDHSLAGLRDYLESIRLAGGGIESASDETASGDAVRLMSLHKSKGLEFPVVVLSLLGRKFNDRDATNRVLTGADWIGVDLFDPATYVQTRTLARDLLADRRRRDTREEEMRILYVALTRAREKLIVTGRLRREWTRATDAAIWRARPEARRWEAEGASCPLDWVTGILAAQGWLDDLDEPGAARQVRPTLSVHRHAADLGLEDGTAAAAPEAPREAARETPRKAAPKTPSEAQPEVPPAALAEFPPAAQRAGRPAAESAPDPAAALPALAARVRTPYAHAAATAWRGKYWVTELKRWGDVDLLADEAAEGTYLLHGEPAPHELVYEEPVPRALLHGKPAPRALPPEERAIDAREEGTWLHAVLEAVDPHHADADGVLDAAARLAASGKVPAAWVTPENLRTVTAFFASSLGREMTAAAASLEREASFSLRLSPQRLPALQAELGELDPEEWVLVQGQIDALWRRPDGSWRVLDFKSDRILSPEQLAARVDGYRLQIQLYLEAVRTIWGAREADGWLYFLGPGEAVPIS